LRQISHMNGVFFEYKIKYTNSKHYIEYYFYIHRKAGDQACDQACDQEVKDSI